MCLKLNTSPGHTSTQVFRRWLISRQNDKSHNAFANDVKIKWPKCCFNVQRGRTTTISFIVVKNFLAISKTFSEKIEENER